MKLRRGSIALQHREVAWKQLGFLQYVIQDIELSLEDESEKYQSLLEQCDPKEISQLRAKFEELLQQENEQLVYAEKNHRSS